MTITVSPQRFRIVSGMTRPSLVATLTRASGAIDLTGATVKLWVGDEYDLIVEGQEMAILDYEGGKVCYGFISSEVSQAGRYKAQIQINSLDGRTERNYRSIDVVIAGSPICN